MFPITEVLHDQTEQRARLLDLHQRLAHAARRTASVNDTLADQGQALLNLLRGSSHPAVLRIAHQLGGASERLREATEQTVAAENAVVAYQASLGVRSDQTGPTPRSMAPVAAPSAGRRPSEILAELPPFEGPGSKTRGVILDRHGRESPLISGENAQTKSRAAHLGLAHVWSAETHVEAHAAAWMQETGEQHAVLMINRRPCPGMQGCDRLLPRLLPSGATLTVYGPNGFTRSYKGSEEDGR